MRESDQMREWLKREPNAIIGGTGGCYETVMRVLDRLDELEWIVATLRQGHPPTKDANHDR